MQTTILRTKKRTKSPKNERSSKTPFLNILWRVLLASPVQLPTYNRVKPKDYDSVSETGSGMRIAPILRKYFR